MILRRLIITLHYKIRIFASIRLKLALIRVQNYYANQSESTANQSELLYFVIQGMYWPH